MGLFLTDLTQFVFYLGSIEVVLQLIMIVDRTARTDSRICKREGLPIVSNSSHSLLVHRFYLDNMYKKINK